MTVQQRPQSRARVFAAERQQPKPGWEWYQPTTISGLPPGGGVVAWAT